ncbi:MAG TPA: glycosyltransferase family 2 protein, partial [Rhodanobacteraceae bacterium]|nr:glycosyltransferase family 2 protein [Rhodanobacteraceae bacterium]
SPPLAPGWYEVRGNLEVRAGKAMLPSLYVRYAEGSALANTELTLSGPDATGRVSALLLFYDTVQSLAFYPSIYPARFVMHDFSLRRVSRWHALRHMLGGPRLGTQGPGSAGRALAWSRSVTGRGLKRATDGLYADYRRRLHPPGLGDYEIWTRKYDTLSAIELAAFRRRAQALDDRGPLISLLLAVDDIPAPSLRRCLDRVLDQVWARWELCVVDRATRAPQVSSVLAEYARRDARIRVMRCERDENIAEASNAVLAMARGEFVALLDADDQLRPHALLRVAESIVADSGLAIVYSDEDRLDPAGQRIDPHFKPDWNPDLLRSRNYFGHLTSIRAALVREAGGFRAGLEDSRDYDLILRCVEQVEPEQIRHIPEILCHRHVTADRATTGRDATQVAATGARALTEHLQRIGADAEIESSGLPPGYHRVRWHLPRPVPKASLIIPTRDRLELLRTCVESILAKSTHPDFEIVVVDNQSGDGATLRYLRELETRENVRVLRYDAPFNYSAINNWAAHQCDGPLIGLVNNDIEVITPDWLEEMAGFAARPDTGAVGAMLYYPDDTIQHAGVLLGMLGLAGHIGAKKPRGWAGHAGRGLVAQNLSAVTGACLLVRREVFEEVGGLDERLPVAFNDIDFCLRVRARGYRNVWTPFAELYHHESASRGDDDTVEKMARSNSEVAFMQARWGQALREDPAYNPNLSLQSQHFELAFPPRDGAATTLG